jgi:hypothetical protein
LREINNVSKIITENVKKNQHVHQICGVVSTLGRGRKWMTQVKKSVLSEREKDQI